MKTVKSIIRFFAPGGVIVAGLCFAQQAQSATGYCAPVKGTMQYSFAFNQNFTDPAVNVTGKIVADAAGKNWKGGKSYRVTCDCEPIAGSNPPRMAESYITAKSPLEPANLTINGKQGFILNKYLAIAASVKMGGKVNKFIAVPFENQSNQQSPDFGQTCENWPYNSGAEGSIDLYFRRPFVGTQTIPSTVLVDVYISAKDGISSPTRASQVTMSGTVTVPQNCDISPQAININFGNIMANDFMKAGAPAKFKKYKQELTLACRNISDGVKIDLSFHGEADNNDNTALKTNNPDVAVRLEDEAGQVISSQGGHLPVKMNYTGQLDSSGKATMVTYPVNTTGKSPAVGEFRATGTVKVEIQ